MYPAVQKEEEGSTISQDMDNSPLCCCWVLFCFVFRRRKPANKQSPRLKLRGHNRGEKHAIPIIK